uniref:Uncharacterized protein n=1 Tax=Chenopodium quinoa TaxID=63459 RepID=A0A803MT07_CHEQI
MPNLMKCANDITTFNTFIQRQRLYQFLAGVSESLDKERRDLLNQDPLPTFEIPYATIRRELARRGIMGASSSSEDTPSETQRWISFGKPQPRREMEDKGHLRCDHYAQTGTIIGRGTKQGGLYYVDETTQHGQAMLTHGSPEHQLWMWHRRDDTPHTYKLPPRSTRGVPPKRYDPEFKARRSKYPVQQVSDENVSETTIAFMASLYSTTIPKNADEALKDEKWRKAMEEEYRALQQNETWE